MYPDIELNHSVKDDDSAGLKKSEDKINNPNKINFYAKLVV